MPTYPFACDTCKVQWDVKMSMSEHEETKGKIICQKCGTPARQVVVRLGYKFVGEGWFGGNADAVASPYGITDMEISRNLDNEKRVEDIANNYNVKHPEG